MPVSSALSSHYRQLLGLVKPWNISDIELNVADPQVNIFLEWPNGKAVLCPECKKRCTIFDRREERVWRHLDTMQFKTFLHCRIPRSNCPVHGTKTITVPWGEANSRWTLMFETFALIVLEQAPTITKAANLLGLSWDQVLDLKKRAVKRGLKRRSLENIEHLGMDEKSFGRKERFITVLSDLDGGRVLDVAPSKSKKAAKAVLEVIPEKQRELIKAVAMDMAAAYEVVCKEMMKQADIVYDKFHIEQKLNKAVDKIRSAEHKFLLAQGINTFTKTRWLWLRRPERWSEKQEKQFRNVEAEFGAGKLAQTKIGRGWMIKEAFRPFWDYVYKGAAKRYFRRWYYWATHSRLKPMIDVAKTINEHLKGVLTYFDHGITNAFSESINSKIQELKSGARGFRNFDNYRISILFSCGKLEMNP